MTIVILMKIFYVVCGSKFQMNTPIHIVREAIKGKYDKYGERARMAEANEGIDWKAISHAYRAGLQLKSIYTKHDIYFPFEGHDRDILLCMKNGELHYKNRVAPMLEELVSEVNELSANSTYPEKAPTDFFNGWLIDFYQTELPNIVKQG